MIKLITALALCLVSFQTRAGSTHESEIGIVVLSGGLESRTINARHSSTVDDGENRARVQGQYLRVSNESKQAKIWDISLRVTRHLDQGVYLFLGKSLESREYKNNTDLGLRYERGIFINEIGYRATVDEVGKHDFIRLYSEIKKDLFKIWVEALLDKTMRIDFEPSLTILLSDKLSLKISYLYKFHRGGPADTIYLTSLIAKY